MTASDLELLSTIIYADREAGQKREVLNVEGLCLQVSQTKPRFTIDYIRTKVDLLIGKGLLEAINNGDNRL